MRLLITGSRDWEGLAAENRLYRVLDSVQEMAHQLGTPLVVVHGDCPTGADAVTDRWARRREPHVTVEPHPADWATAGKAAGFYRNQHMVNLGADLCIGFIRNKSGGTADCLGRAKSAGIPVFIIKWEEGWDVVKNDSYRRADSGGAGHPVHPTGGLLP